MVALVLPCPAGTAAILRLAFHGTRTTSTICWEASTSWR